MPALLLEAGGAYAASLVIDDFSPTQGSTSTKSVNQVVRVGKTALGDPQIPFNEQTNGDNPPFLNTEVIGGYRDLFLTNVRGDTDVERARGIVSPKSSTMNPGTLRFTNQSSISSRLEVTWDGQDNLGGMGEFVNTTGLGGVNLSRDGELDAIGLNFQFADQNISGTINIWDMMGNQVTATFNFPDEIMKDETVHFFFEEEEYNISDSLYKTLLNPVTGGTFDFTNVGAIQLALMGNEDTARALDARVDSIESVDIVQEVKEVPEPSSLLALISMAVLGMLSGRRYQGKS